MGANLGAMAFHGQYYRRKFGKLGIVVLAGKPNVGKSKDIMTALHMASSLQYFFAKVDILFWIYVRIMIITFACSLQSSFANLCSTKLELR